MLKSELFKGLGSMVMVFGLIIFSFLWNTAALQFVKDPPSSICLVFAYESDALGEKKVHQNNMFRVEIDPSNNYKFNENLLNGIYQKISDQESVSKLTAEVVSVHIKRVTLLWEFRKHELQNYIRNIQKRTIGY